MRIKPVAQGPLVHTRFKDSAGRFSWESEHIVLMAKINKSEGVKSVNKQREEMPQWRLRTQASKGPLPKDHTEHAKLPPATGCDNMCSVIC